MKLNLFIIGLCLLLFSACQRTLYFAFWQSAPVVADGKAKEWSVPLNYYDADTKLQYTISNDRQNLYVCLKAGDEQTQLKIIRGGMRLWIDTTGHNRNHVGVLFPMPNHEPLEKTAATSDNSDAPVPGSNYTSYGSAKNKGGHKVPVSALKKAFYASPKEMQLAGFKPPLGGLTSIENKSGIFLGLDWDSTNTMVYEAVIPFKTFYKDSLSYKDSLKIFGVSITVNGLTAPSGAHSGGHGGGDASMPGGIPGAGGMSGMGGRGGAGGRRGGTAAPINPLYENASIKTQIRLAVQPHKHNKLMDW